MISLHQVSFVVATLSAIMIGTFLWSKLAQQPDVYAPQPAPPTPPRLEPLAICKSSSPIQLPDDHLDEIPFLSSPCIPNEWIKAAKEDRQYDQALSKWYFPWNMCKIAYYTIRSSHRGEKSLDLQYSECQVSVEELLSQMDRYSAQSNVLKKVLSRLGGSVKRSLGLVAKNLNQQCSSEQEFQVAVQHFRALMIEAGCQRDCILPNVFIDFQLDVGECIMRLLMSLAGQSWTHNYSHELIEKLREYLEDVARAVMPLIIIRLTRVSWVHLFLTVPTRQDVQQLSLHGTVSSKLIRDGLLHDIYRVASHVSNCSLNVDVNGRRSHGRLTKYLKSKANCFIKKHVRCSGYALARPIHCFIRSFDSTHAMPPIMSDYLL